MPNDICITLAHDGGVGPITFVVTDPRDLSDTVVVLNSGDPPQDVCLLDWPCDAGGVVIPVTANDEPFDQNVTVDCQGTLDVASVVLCDPITGEATVILTGEAIDCPVAARIYNPATDTSQVVIFEPGQQQEIRLLIPCGGCKNEIAAISVSATSGSWYMTATALSACATNDLPFDITAAALQVEVENLLTCLQPDLGWGPGDVIVTGGPGSEQGGSPYFLEFVGQLACESVWDPYAFTLWSIDLAGGSSKFEVIGGVTQEAGLFVDIYLCPNSPNEFLFQRIPVDCECPVPINDCPPLEITGWVKYG